MNDKYLTWLPDEKATVQVENRIGPVHPAAPDTFYDDVIQAMDGGEELSGMTSARQELRKQIRSGEAYVWRGLLAFCLLEDLLVPEMHFQPVTVTASSGRLSRSVLRALNTDTVRIYAMVQDSEQIPLGMLDPEMLIIPARNMGLLKESLNLAQRVSWFDGKTFMDPAEYLTPLMRSVLIRRLRASGAGTDVQQFAAELEDRERKIVENALGDDRKYWEKAVKCVLGLSGEKGFEELTEQTSSYVSLGGNDFLHAFDVQDPVVTLPQETSWSWKGILLARESHLILVERETSEQAVQALEELALDEEILEKCVQTYTHSLQEKLEDVLRARQFPDEIAEQVRGWCGQMDRSGQKPAGNITLTYPWRTASPALESLLQDTLGETLGSAAMHPFSDRILLMDGASMDDSMLEKMCTVSWEGGSCLILPPLSREMAQWESENSTENGYVQESLKAQMDASGKVSISYIIRGTKGSITVNRTYSSLEQVMMRSEQVPVVSLWPSVPLPSDRWSAYYVSVRGRISAEVYSGFWHSAASEDTEEGGLGVCHVVKTETFPSVILLSRNGLTLGTLMYAPEMYVPQSAGECIAAFDLGESGTAVAWAGEDGSHELNMPSLWHVVLRGERWDPSGEVLPSFPLSSVVESAVVLLEGSGTVPFEDGYICSLMSMETAHPCCHFLWRSDSDGERAQRILMRQLMLMTGFDMVMHGASSVTWHVSVPFAMGREDRLRMQKEMEHAARDVQELCSLRIRGVYAAWHDTRCAGQFLYSHFSHASFLMMDCGGGDGSVAVWLRGMPQPVLEVDAGDGLAMQLHTAFLNIPMTASVDMQIYPWMNVTAFSEQLVHARESVEAWEESRRQVDRMLGEHLQETADMLNYALQNNCANYTQSLMILEMAKRMVICGLALERVGNESTLSDRLPSNLPVILCGRGGNVYLSLSYAVQGSLLRFASLPLRQTHPVSKLHLESSECPKMEAAYGLLMQPSHEMLRARITEMRGTVPLDWLLGHFLMLFYAMFPQPSSVLFPGSCLPNGMLSDYYANMILSLASSWQTEKTADALSGCLERLRAWPITTVTGNTGEMQPASPVTGEQMPGVYSGR